MSSRTWTCCFLAATLIVWIGPILVVSGEADDSRPEEELLARIDELSKPLPSSGDFLEHAKQRADRQRMIVEDVEALLERFPESIERSRLMRLRLKCLFHLVLHAGEPFDAFEGEIDQVLRDIEKRPDPALEADAAAWKIRCMVSRLQREGRPVEEVRNIELKKAEEYVKRFPKSPFSPRMLEALIVNAWARKASNAKGYIESLKANFPNHVITSAVEATLWRRAAIGQPLALSIETLDGKAMQTKDLKGKVILIQFWATFSPASMGHLTELRELYAAYHSKGLEIIGVSLDADRPEVERALAEHRVSWPQSHDKLGWAGPIVKQLAVFELPTTLLIDREGVLRRLDAHRDARNSVLSYFP
jgi:peroxiredoxin